MAVVVAAVAGWFLAGSSEKGAAELGRSGTATATPVVSAQPEAPVATAGTGPALPAETGVPVPPPIAGSGPTASTGPGAAGEVSPSSTAGQSPTDNASPDVSPGPEGKRLTSKGGVVYAKCAQGKATLTSWEPASGYSVEKVQPGPALAAVIVFKGTPGRYRMNVTCVAGTPTAVVLPL